MRLQPSSEHPHGLSDPEFDALFTVDRPVVFAYHGYPWLIHRLTYRRTNHHNLHVRGYKEEGTTTTPFDMVMLNDLDRFHLVMDVIDRVPGLASRAGHVRQLMVDRRLECRAYTRHVGDDPPEIRDWTWGWAAGRMSRPERILVVNAGSSSLKLRLPRRRRPRRGQLGPGGPPPARSTGRPWPGRSPTLAPPDAIGHRIVHGGRRYLGPVRLDDRGRAGPAGADRPGPAPPAEVARCPRSGQGALPGCARRRLLRHRVPRGACRPRRRPTRCPVSGASAGTCAAYGFHGLSHAYATRRASALVGRPIDDSPNRHLPPWGRCVARRRRRRARRLTRRWASRRSRVWSWRPARAASTRA